MLTSLYRCTPKLSPPREHKLPFTTRAAASLGLAVWGLWPKEYTGSGIWEFWAQLFKGLSNYTSFFLQLMLWDTIPQNSATKLEAQATQSDHLNENWRATINSPRWASKHSQDQLMVLGTVITEVPADLGPQMLQPQPTSKGRTPQLIPGNLQNPERE